MMPFMKIRALSSVSALVVCLVLPCSALAQHDQLQKPMAGPRATALRITSLYVSPDTGSQRVDRVQVGREMVVAEKSGDWLRVFANTDAAELRDRRDEAWIESPDDTPPPVSGWIQARGIVVETMPDGDKIIMGEAANEEHAASDPRGPANAAQSARFLYRRVVEMYPNSPLTPEAAWRAADILWQLQKADQATRPSAKEASPTLREGMDETEMKYIVKRWPRTRQADLAAYELLDNKLCGDWQGQEKCPEREANLYEHYADEHPDGPRTAEALYQAVYRSAVLVDLYKADHNNGKADDARKHAQEISQRLTQKFPDSDYTRRSLAIVFKVNQSVPVYGIDLQ